MSPQAFHRSSNLQACIARLGSDPGRGTAPSPPVNHQMLAGGIPLTAPCFSWAYFFRTACKLLDGAALCKALMSRMHGMMAASV